MSEWWPARWVSDDPRDEWVMTRAMSEWWPARWVSDDPRDEWVMTRATSEWWPARWVSDDPRDEWVMTRAFPVMVRALAGKSDPNIEEERFNPFTLKSDQFHISPAASPGIFRWNILCWQFPLPHSYMWECTVRAWEWKGFQSAEGYSTRVKVRSLQ